MIKKAFLVFLLLMFGCSGLFADQISRIHVYWGKFLFPILWKSSSYLYTYVTPETGKTGLFKDGVYYTNSNSLNLSWAYRKDGNAQRDAWYKVLVDGVRASNPQSIDLAAQKSVSVYSWFKVHSYVAIIIWGERIYLAQNTQEKSTTVEVVHDTDGPVLTIDAPPGSEYMHYDDQSVFYSDQAQTLSLRVSGIEDGGVGMDTPQTKAFLNGQPPGYFGVNDVLELELNNLDTNTENELKFVSEDRLGNTSSIAIPLVYDSGVPDINPANLEFAPFEENGLVTGYITTVSVDVSDNLSGVREVSLEFEIDKKSAAGRSIIEKSDGITTYNSASGKTIARMALKSENNDGTYTGFFYLPNGHSVDSVIVAEDNVSNIGSSPNPISVVAAPIVSLPPEIIAGQESRLALELKAAVGSNYADPENGLNSIKLELEGFSEEPLVFNNILEAPYLYPESSSEQDEDMTNLTFRMDLPDSIPPHSELTLKGTVLFVNGITLALMPGNSPFSKIRIPNVGLGKGNGFELQHFRDNQVIDTYSSDELLLPGGEPSLLFFNGVATLKLANTQDKEGDKLTLYYLDEDKQPVFEESGTLTIIKPTNNIFIREHIEETGEFINYPLNLHAVTDSSLDTDRYDFIVTGYGTTPEGLPTSHNGPFEVEVRIIEDDESGLAALKVFRADEYLVTGKPIVDPSRYNGSGISIIDNKEDNSYTGSITVEVPEGSDGLYHIGLYIEDKAGNTGFKVVPVVIDNIPVEPLYMGENGIVADMTDLDYSYDDQNDRISLCVKLNVLDGDYNVRDYALEGSSDYPGINFHYDSELSRLNVELDETVAPNTPLPILLTIVDFAGNRTTQNITLYTPAELANAVGKYLDNVPPYQSPDGDYTIAWQVKAAPEASGYRLYRLNNGVEELLEAFEDVGLSAHKLNTYRLKAVNGGGFESTHAGSYLDFSRRVENALPVVEVFSADFASDGTISGTPVQFWGPQSIFSLRVSDLDAGDTLTLEAYREGSLLNTMPVNPGESLSLSLSNIFGANTDWETGRQYQVSLCIKDSWEDEEGHPIVEQGTYFGPGTVVYDDAGPELEPAGLSRHPGFSYGYGVFDFSAVDELSGLEYSSVQAELEGSALEVSQSSGTEFSVGDIPDGSGMTLFLRASDVLGNETLRTVSGVNKDTVSPTISNLKVNAESGGGRYILDRPFAPLTITWEDSLSGASRVEYRILDEGNLLAEDSIDSYGGFLNDTAGTWEVLIPWPSDVEGTLDLEIAIVDNGGNRSDWISSSQPILVDVVPPLVTFSELSGFVNHGGLMYAVGSDIDGTLSILDAGGVAASEYQWSKNDGPWNSMSSIKQINSYLQDGSDYHLRAEVVDVAGNIGYTDTINFTVDTKAPVVDVSSFTMPVREYLPGEVLRFSVNATDNSSLVKSLLVRIGKEGESFPSLTGSIDGHDDEGNLEFLYIANGDTYGLTIPENADGEYIISFSALDVFGHQSSWMQISGINLSVINESERIAVNDAAVFSSDPRNLRASWIYRGSSQINHYLYRIIRDSDGHTVSDWRAVQDSGVNHRFDNDLVHGELYRFEVKAVTEDGSRIASSLSAGTRLDLNKPKITTATISSFMNDSGAFISWHIEEDVSGLRNIDLILESVVRDDTGTILTEVIEIDGAETVIPQTEIVGVRPLRLDETVSLLQVNMNDWIASGVVVQGQEYRCCLRVTDKAENSVKRYLGEVVYDSTPPPLPVILDQGDYLNPETNKPFFSWGLTESDPESGTAEYRYQLINATGYPTAEAWITTDTAIAEFQSIDLPEDGKAIVLAVEVINGAGRRSLGFSDGIIIDRTKPSIPNITIRDNSLGTEYFDGDEITLTMESVDEESGIVSYEYQPVIYNAGAWVPIGENRSVIGIAPTVELNPDDEDYSSVLEPGVSFAYRVSGINGAGELSSLPGYSSILTVVDEVASIHNLVGFADGGTLNFLWELENTSVAPASFSALLKGPNGYERNEMLDGTARSVSFEINGDVLLDEGRYTLELTLTDEAGRTNSNPVVSSAVYLDYSAPVFVEADYPRFGNEDWTLRIVAVDALTGMSRIRYRIGTLADPFAYSGNWVEQEAVNGTLSLYVSLEDVAHGSILEIDLTAEDRSGNRSALYRLDSVLVDKTGPVVTEPLQNTVYTLDGQEYSSEQGFISDPGGVGRMELTISDAESGIAAYRWALIPNETTALEENWSALSSLEDVEYGLSKVVLRNHYFSNSRELIEGNLYQLAVQAVNRAGVMSTPVYSAPLIADFTAISLDVDYSRSGLKSEVSPSGETRIVVNGDDQIVLTLSENSVSFGKISWLLLDTGGIPFDKGDALLRDDEELVIPFLPGDNPLAGEYRLSLKTQDIAGRQGYQSLPIRLNSPPSVEVSEINTRPGLPVSLDGMVEFFDEDGIALWSIALYGDDELLGFWNDIDLDSWSTELSHREPMAQTSEYRLLIEATDTLGLTGSGEAGITVRNTSEGELFADEYWSGTHRITGPVVVPSGRNLTLAPDTEILAVVVPGAENLPSLIIEEGAQLLHEGTATYRPDSLSSEDFWSGLVVRGTAFFDGVTIEKALRGLSLIGSGVDSLSNISFLSNKIGLHLYNASPQVDGCLFSGNLYYGVKEDGGASPVMTGNRFDSNGYDYYHEGGLLLDADRINGLSSANKGNQ